MAKNKNGFMARYNGFLKRHPFVARVIEVPKELNSLVVVAITGFFVYLEAQAFALLGVDFHGLIVAVGVALAAVLTFGVKALLEEKIPESLHGVVNALLAFLALILGGGAAARLFMG